MALNIRFAEPQDASGILGLIKGLAEFEKLSHEVTATEEELRKTIFEGGYAQVLMAEWEGELAGFALFFHNYSTFLAKPGIYLEDLFVLPKFRSRGIGLEMLKTLARIAVEKGCGRLEWSVLDWNKEAIKFYLRLGSKPMDDWTVHRLTGQALVDLAKS